MLFYQVGEDDPFRHDLEDRVALQMVALKFGHVRQNEVALDRIIRTNIVSPFVYLGLDSIKNPTVEQVSAAAERKISEALTDLKITSDRLAEVEQCPNMDNMAHQQALVAVENAERALETAERCGEAASTMVRERQAERRRHAS